MAPFSRKRKAAALTANSQPVAAFKGIAAFARVSKVQALPDWKIDGEKDGISKKPVIEDLENHSTSVEEIPTKKRKIEDSIALPAKRARIGVCQANPPKAFASSPAARTFDTSSPPTTHLPSPLGPRKKLPKPSRQTETPTKAARAFLAAFDLSSSAPTSPRSSPPLSEDHRREDTPPTSPLSENSPCPLRGLKEREGLNGGWERQDLISLNAAFLTTLTIHYAHHVYNAPVDLRVLKAGIERSWGKRAIRTVDIQTIFGIAHTKSVETSASKNILSTQKASRWPLSLSDYGHGKICIELDNAASQASNHAQPLDIKLLTAHFCTALDILDLEELPLFPITACSSLEELSPLHQRTRNLLSDIKTGAQSRLQNNNHSSPLHRTTSTSSAISSPLSSQLSDTNTSASSTPTKSKPAPLTRTNSLLDRIRAKQAASTASSLNSSTPTPERLSSRAAYQRLDEIIPVLELLTTQQMMRRSASFFTSSDSNKSSTRSTNDIVVNSEQSAARKGQTFSFTMPMIVQHLQTSLKNPIAKEDVVRSMRLLGDERIGKGWVVLREGVGARGGGIGSKKNVSGGGGVGSGIGMVVCVRAGVGALRGNVGALE
ncbi:hypothetical protein MMC25_002354 [Agyrium rufum]|nr:hypothetical protein [Agyrium rufum]